MSISSLAIAVDLSLGFGPARSQGQRPTCLAFAASDCHGHAIGGEFSALSVEYAFYHAVERMVVKDRSTGVNFGAISTALGVDGQPEEYRWPYIPNLGPDDDWAPPVNPGDIFHGKLDRISRDLGSVRDALDECIPVLLIMDISKSFFRPELGEIINADSAERSEGVHAVIAVGYGHLDKAASYLVRNSWGEKWGSNGYAWLHEDYLEPRLRVAGVFAQESQT